MPPFLQRIEPYTFVRALLRVFLLRAVSAFDARLNVGC